SQKPVYRPAVRVTRHILEGKVVNSDDNAAEEGVRVILSNRGGAFADRVTMTDAYGRYAVRVPDGDWTVKVTMPSGRVYAVSELTISGGEITDDLGRNVPSLTITR
ncbi:carboxypeptidase-like regulatory domain-containing protein, partial [Singulisphaera rosea]